MKNTLVTYAIIAGLASTSCGKNQFESDTVETTSGNLIMTFIGHGTLMFEFGGLIIHIDPVSAYADYSQLPDADIILVTHDHFDHLDKKAIKKIRKDNTKILCSESCLKEINDGIAMKNGETQKIERITIDAVPAYNLVHKKGSGEPFHPKGAGNGYVLTCGNKRIYVAGDTENIPEMKKLTGIDIAFLPMNLPYTMTPKMVAEAIALFNPRVVYPYHYGETKVNELVELVKDKKGCEVRIRKLQ